MSYQHNSSGSGQSDRFTSKGPINNTPTNIFLPADYLFVQISQDGKRKYYNQNGQEQKILPTTDVFFKLIDNGQIIKDRSPEEVSSMKETNKRKFNINPDSHIYNYDVKNLLNLMRSYENELTPEENKKLKKQFVSTHRDISIMKGINIVYLTYFLTSFSKKWHKLTFNYRPMLINFIFVQIFFAIAYVQKQIIPFALPLKNPIIFEKIVRRHEQELQL